VPFPHPQPSAIWLAHRARIRILEEQQELVRAERLRIARGLHDTPSHSFTGVII
jgi:signal transduction histidine kinase